jgi:hypothetical protein
MNTTLLPRLVSRETSEDISLAPAAPAVFPVYVQALHHARGGRGVLAAAARWAHSRDHGVIVCGPELAPATAAELAHAWAQDLNWQGPTRGCRPQDALLAAFAWLDAGALPGVWILLPGETGDATALGLSMQGPGCFLAWHSSLPSDAEPLNLHDLAHALDGRPRSTRRWSLGSAGSITLAAPRPGVKPRANAA